ncbi:hypothetical protein [Rubrivivax gelatinosus]|uniref:Uncharacterized protein n=1 Tax=Rubrivivax gelatinosus (strain NBRC 100245 / IL144) TaxID=983917 RepID=I0HM28_RUBGI|nr:hypothetical protein [Rubrivivax gelatinosus]BAL94065.1 hypothetical protein RGE_07220 [Rubrivivax gelatinosus IL144]
MPTQVPHDTLPPDPVSIAVETDVQVLTFEIAGGEMTLDVEPVAVASARADMPALMRRSAETGRGFLIRNARNPAAASALLIDPEVLKRRIAEARPPRTLGQLVEGLPFRGLGANPLLDVPALPDDVLPELEIPVR